MADVFLDLWGVLTDSAAMEAAYRQRQSEILRSRYGGSLEAWLRAHDVAYAWYSEHMEKPETWEGATWLQVVDRSGAESIVRTFREAGGPPPGAPRGLPEPNQLQSIKS